MKKPLRVLMVEDSEDDALLTILALKKGGYDPAYERVEDAGAMRKALQEKPWDVILCDYQLPQFNGLAAIDLLKEARIDIPLIIVSGAIGEETAVECMRLGAFDYIMKSNLPRLSSAIERELKEAESRLLRKLAEEALRESEEKYRWVLDNMADVITVMDMNLHFTYVSPSILRMRGYTAKEAVTQTLEQVMTPESLQISAKAFEEEMKLEASGTEDPNRIRILEVEQYRKDGSIVLMENHLSFLRDEAKKAVGIISVSHDITERKEAEDKIKKQTDAMESAIDGIAILNKDEEYIYLNQAHARIYGYENAGELIVKSWRSLYDSDQLQRFDAEIMPKFSKEEFWQGETLGMKKDGSKFPQEISLTALDGGGLICIVHDITKRKQAEEMLRESEEKYRELVKYAPAGLYEVDYETGLFKSVNDVMCEYTGYTRDELLNTNLYNLLTEESQKLMRERIEKLSAGEKMPQTFEYCIRTKKGEKIWALLNARYIYEERKLKGATGVIYNINERKRAEESLRENEERYKALFDRSLDLVYIIDFEGRFLDANQAALNRLGYNREKISSLNFATLLSEDQVPIAFQTMREIIDTGYQKNVVELRLKAKNGNDLFVESIGSVILHDGIPYAIQGIARDITERKQAEKDLQKTLDRLRKAFGTIIQVMVSAVETRDPYTAGHQIRVADIARAIATEMGFSQEKIEGIRMAGSIHDIGKLSIPAEILSKPGKLSAIEFSLVKEHARTGYEMLKDVESPWPLAQIVYQHHERMDGSGYPRKLKGDEILMEARIMAVADVVESMASYRPYRPALGIDEALKEIEKNKVILYDDAVADACLRLFREKGFQIKGTLLKM